MTVGTIGVAATWLFTEHFDDSGGDLLWYAQDGSGPYGPGQAWTGTS